MNIKKEEVDASVNQTDDQNLFTQDSTLRSKFQKKDSQYCSDHRLISLQNMIKKMNTSDLIKKHHFTEIERKITRQQQKVDQNSDIEIYLHNLKKSYDELIKQITKKQKETDKLKQEIDTMKKKIKVSNEKNVNQKISIDEMQKRWDALKMKQQTSKLASKTFQHILQRMKKDQIVYKIKNNQLERKAKDLNILIFQNTNKSLNIHEFQTLSMMAATTIRNAFNQVSDKRMKQMRQYSLILQRKKQSQKKKQQRLKVTEEIQAMAASDMNDVNLIKWKKLLLVQKFLKKFLKEKMLNLQIKYKDVKSAYHKIKSKTSVNDSTVLATHYFSLEQTYTNLLQSIKCLEEKSYTLQMINKSLRKRYDEAKNEIFVFQQQTNDNDTYLKQRSHVKQISEKSKIDQLIYDKIYYWLINNLYKIEKTSSQKKIQKKQYYDTYPKSKLDQGIKHLFQLIKSQAMIIKQTNLHETVDYQKLKQLQKVVTSIDDDQEISQQDKKYENMSRITKSKKTFKLI